MYSTTRVEHEKKTNNIIKIVFCHHKHKLLYAVSEIRVFTFLCRCRKVAKETLKQLITRDDGKNVQNHYIPELYTPRDGTV